MMDADVVMLFVHLAEALSRLIPNANSRVIFVIRHGHATDSHDVPLPKLDVAGLPGALTPKLLYIEQTVLIQNGVDWRTITIFRILPLHWISLALMRQQLPPCNGGWSWQSQERS